MNAEIARLPDPYPQAIQAIACTSNLLLQRNMIGLSKEDLKKHLKTRDDDKITDFLRISNAVLKEETVPAQIIYDDVYNKYIYVQCVTPALLAERLSTAQMLVLLLLYYKQVVVGEDATTLQHLVSLIDPSVADKPLSRMQNILKPLLEFGLLKPEGEKFHVTGIAKHFMTLTLLGRTTAVAMGRNYSKETIFNFFRADILNPKGYREEPMSDNMSLFREV